MTVELHHVTMPATDRRRSAAFLAGILGVPVGADDDGRSPVTAGNGVTLDYVDGPVDGTAVAAQRCTFLLTEDEFDAAYARLLDARVRIWADPERTRPGQIDHRRGRRGLCFSDPDGHVIEIVTRPDGARDPDPA
ncbi:MAG TPA: VOC family protein [Acidimicrobiales bacterium]